MATLLEPVVMLAPGQFAEQSFIIAARNRKTRLVTDKKTLPAVVTEPNTPLPASAPMARVAGAGRKLKGVSAERPNLLSTVLALLMAAAAHRRIAAAGGVDAQGNTAHRRIVCCLRYWRFKAEYPTAVSALGGCKHPERQTADRRILNRRRRHAGARHNLRANRNVCRRQLQPAVIAGIFAKCAWGRWQIDDPTEFCFSCRIRDAIHAAQLQTSGADV